MSYYRKHLFFCNNSRSQGKQCCANKGAKALRDYAKAKCKSLGLHKKGELRMNLAGCLGRCADGPVVVVYPDGIWYSCQTENDVDAIIDEHLLQDQPVTRLMLSQEPG